MFICFQTFWQHSLLYHTNLHFVTWQHSNEIFLKSKVTSFESCGLKSILKAKIVKVRDSFMFCGFLFAVTSLFSLKRMLLPWNLASTRVEQYSFPYFLSSLKWWIFSQLLLLTHFKAKIFMYIYLRHH